MPASPVERYRKRLQDTIARLESRNTNRNRGFAAVVRTLLLDFERVFSSRIPPAIQHDIDQHCFEDQAVCPLCGSPLALRNGPHGEFLGCTKYPDCHGSRKIDGTPSINDAMKKFLEKKKKEATQSSSSNTNRFSRLEM